MVPPPHPNSTFFEEIGRLCTAWAYLENIMQTLIWEGLGVDEEIGQYITYHLDAKRRWETLTSITEGKNPDLHKKLKTLNGAISNLTGRRNLAVHGLVTGFGGDPNLYWVGFKGAKAGQPQLASTEIVRAIRTEVQNLAHELRPSTPSGT